MRSQVGKRIQFIRNTRKKDVHDAFCKSSLGSQKEQGCLVLQPCFDLILAVATRRSHSHGAKEVRRAAVDRWPLNALSRGRRAECRGISVGGKVQCNLWSVGRCV